MRCGVAQAVTRVGDTLSAFEVKAFAICLRGRSFMRPFPSRNQPM